MIRWLESHSRDCQVGRRHWALAWLLSAWEAAVAPQPALSSLPGILTLAVAPVSFSDVIALLALVVSLAAAAAGYYFGRRQALTARQANQIPALIDLFREHRSPIGGRQAMVWGGTSGMRPDGWPRRIPIARREAVRQLTWFYDNLGALVAHGIVDLEPVEVYPAVLSSCVGQP